ncbi:MAG: hypothetical protein HYR56_23430 [Acidobacteria bacterium]|nr:hypothetical protein [Acidobacteriota bacterium]MBI3422821.1 hypothetical protein [Acidobacteriota bacterium]
MKPLPRKLFVIVLAVITGLALLASTQAAPQKKKKKAAAAGETAAEPAETGKAPGAPPAKVEGPAAEKDPARESWRINVEPYAILGSGRPGKAVADFDKPDGVAFGPQGWLFATDAKNRRVQVWDVKTKTHLGEFGHGTMGGEIVDIAVAPNGMALVTDQILNLAYAYVPPKPGDKDDKGRPLGPYDYVFKGTRFGERHFDKLGGIAIDSKNRVYAVDAHLNQVFRYTPEGADDPAWQFAKQRGDGDTYLHGCEGIAIDEAAGNIYIASEKDSIIQVFDWETGAYKGKLVGARNDGAGKPLGKSVFSGSVEGLAIANKHLFAVDESVGHIQIFDLNSPGAFNRDLLGFGPTLHARSGGYKGFVGHSPQVDFEDKTNKALQNKVKLGEIIPGQANPPGYFCSPDSIATYTDKASGETYIAVADQCNYRLAVYRWSDIARALSNGPAAALAPASTPATDAEPAAEKGGKGGKKKGKKKGQ